MQTEQNAQALSLKTVAGTKSNSLVIISKTEGEAVTLAILIKEITSLANYFNVGKNLNREQAEEIARLTASEYYYLTEEHFLLMVRRAKLGKYASVKIMDRFDGGIWFEYLALFLSEVKDAKIEIENEKRIEEFNEWEKKAVPMPKEVAEALQEMKRKFAKKKQDEKDLRQVKESEEAKELRQKVNERIQLFNKIYNLGKRDTTNGVRFIEYLGKKVDLQEFLLL